jgi:hypothetical protein
MNKGELINSRLKEFIRQLSIDADEPVLASMIVVQWNNETTTGVSMVPLPKPETLKVVKAMGRAITAGIERLIVQINTSSSRIGKEEER